jgi:hypothetical protein
MQPCGVCGGVGIDAAGYCTQCRTYRGVPHQAPPESYDVLPPGMPSPASPAAGTVYGAPSSGPPQYGAPYGGSTSAPPYGGGSTSAPPYGGSTSGPPYGTTYGTPTSGAPYPATTYGAPAPAPTRGRSSFLVPLLALSATLVVLVVAIVVVVIVKSSGKGGKAGPGGNATGSSLVDTCVVGNWNEKSHEETTPIDGFVGKVTFKGSGALLHLKADGTGSYEYNGTEYSGTGRRASDDSSVEIKLKITGSITFSYRTNNNTFSFSDMKASGSAIGFLDGQQIPGSQPLEPDANPASYTCSGNDMTHTNPVYTVQWGRR